MPDEASPFLVSPLLPFSPLLNPFILRFRPHAPIRNEGFSVGDRWCMSQTQNECERDRLLAEARAAHRTADRERSRARNLASRLARRLRHTLDTARAQLDADRAQLDARDARFNEAQSNFNITTVADRERQRAAWAEIAARQQRLADEWDEANRFHAAQTAAIDSRTVALAAREKGEADARIKIQREVAVLREEAAALDARSRNARQVVDELERQREQLRFEALAPVPGAEPPMELSVALDRATDRDLTKWADELARKEDRMNVERATVTTMFASVARDKDGLNDRRRLLAEQFAQLAAARAGWQEAERATVVEMEHLARTLRHRESELDAREHRLGRADARRREDAYELWQLRLRLEAWQSKLVAFEMRWHTEREHLEASLARREEALIARQASDDGIPFATAVNDARPAIPAELAALREEVERMAGVLLEMDLPEPPDLPPTELPWGDVVPEASDAESDEVLAFDFANRAA